MGKQKNPLKPLEYQPFNPHKAFEMLRKDTDTIVIFIHGFLGSPHQFISLADFVYHMYMRVPLCYFRVMAVQRRILHIVRSNNGQSRSIKKCIAMQSCTQMFIWWGILWEVCLQLMKASAPKPT